MLKERIKLLTPKIYDLSIVLVGDINPVIIQPFWLVNKGLIQETEGENTNVEVIHNEIVKFELDWVSFEITRQRIQLRTSKESHFPMIRDLIVSIFKILKDTPLKNLGINHIMHFEFKEDTYLNLGKGLAPFENWTDIMSNPRLQQIEMTDQPRQDGYRGHYRVRIAPSELIRPFGVSMNINDQYNRQEQTLGSIELITILNSAWADSLSRAKNTHEQLWQKLKI